MLYFDYAKYLFDSKVIPIRPDSQNKVTASLSIPTHTPESQGVLPAFLFAKKSKCINQEAKGAQMYILLLPYCSTGDTGQILVCSFHRSPSQAPAQDHLQHIPGSPSMTPRSGPPPSSTQCPRGGGEGHNVGSRSVQQPRVRSGHKAQVSLLAPS